MLVALLAVLAQGYAESPYLFGLHDPGGERHMAEKGRKGWILFTESIGRNPAAAGTDPSYDSAMCSRVPA